MNRIITLFAALVCALTIGSSSLYAQKNEDLPYKIQKAYDVLNEDNDTDQALDLLSEQLKETPENVDAYFLRARIYRNLEKYSQAISSLNQVIKYNNKKSDIEIYVPYWWKGTIYEEMEEMELAEAAYKTAYELATKAKSKNLYSVSFDYAEILYANDKFDLSDSIYKKMLESDESDASAMVGLARNMNKREKYDEALALLEKAEKFSATYPSVHYFKAMTYDKLGQTDKAIDSAIDFYVNDDDKELDQDLIDIFMKHTSYTIAKAKEQKKTSDDSAFWAVFLTCIYEEACDYENVIAAYNQLEEDYGKDESIYSGRADAYNELGLKDLALSEIDKALELDDDISYHNTRLQILRESGKFDEALKECDLIIDRFPTNAYGYYVKGLCYEMKGDDESAMKYYNEGIDLDKDYPYIYLMRGEQYLKVGKTDLANADFEQIIAKDTTATDGSCRQYALHFLGKDDEAIEWQNKIIENDSLESGNYYDRACLLARIGKLDESVAALEEAFEKGYINFNHIVYDDDMDPIRDRDDFKALISKYEDKLATRIASIGADVTSNEEQITEIDIKRHSGGTFDIACEVNGLPLEMIFDTGASDVSISKVEADFMLKNNYLSKDDVKGKQYYQTADGGLSEGTVITLKEVKIGDAVLHNVNASVVKSQKAPLLLGESVLSRFGTFTVDNINSKLIIKH